MFKMNQTALDLLNEERHDFDSLVRVMELLRAPGGCPWDREQTHETIRGNFIEETYEVIEAIDTSNASLLREELGDVLLQVVFHARISEEAGNFSIEDVIHDITEKLIRRHPHVFADVEADTSDEVLKNWEAIKKEEKQRVGIAGTLGAVPPSLPALMRAQTLMKKAGKAGIVPDPDMLAKEISAVAAQLSNAIQNANEESIARLAGKMAFLTAAAGQHAGCDVEELLSKESNNFVNSLTECERKGGDFSGFLDEKRRIVAQNAYFSHKN